jgi:hypothetical protein
MGRIQKADAVAKHKSTSFYGNVVALSESPLEEDLLYAGTDDGLVQVQEGEGSGWRRIEQFKGVPEMTYVSDLEASRHDASTVYASFDNHKNGDFRPYLLLSTDRGRTWTSITGNLPERGSVHTVAEDHVRPDLLFAGTEFGLFFTVDGGGKWTQLKGGMPTIAVRDLEIQRRENDLVAGTFGRGIMILDDYTPLRLVSEELLEKEAAFFPVKRAWMYMPAVPLGLRDKSFQGDSFYLAPNPPFGAVFTYYLKTLEELRKEDREESPSIILTVSDQEGNVLRRLTGPTKAGFHRVAWDLRLPPSEPVRLKPPEDPSPFQDPPMGPMAVPGDYSVSLAKRVDGVTTPLGEPLTFSTVPLGIATLPAGDREALLEFQRKTARLQRAVLGAVKVAGEARERIDYLERALLETPEATDALADELLALKNRLKEIQDRLSGDSVLRKRSVPRPRSIVERVERIIWSQWSSSSAPTRTNRDAYKIAGKAFSTALAELQALIESDLEGFEESMEKAGAPWTPGRVPRWTLE